MRAVRFLERAAWAVQVIARQVAAHLRRCDRSAFDLAQDRLMSALFEGAQHVPRGLSFGAG
jgi:hypothetical protein